MRKLLDQYHIDIYATDELTEAERDQIDGTFVKPDWLEKLLQAEFGTELREKILIKITR